MNRVQKIILGGAVLALSAVAAVNFPMAAAQEGTTPGKRPFARGERMRGGFAGAPIITMALNHKSELNLTSDQVTNLEKIKSHYQSQVTPLQQQLQGLEKDIASLSQKSPADLIQIKSKIQEGEKLRSELRYQRIEALENGKSVLNTQQQEQLKTLVRSGHGRFRNPQGQPS
jgi:Spy/CpxP family protein refolding chaperone